jgi:hypothetical protein
VVVGDFLRKISKVIWSGEVMAEPGEYDGFPFLGALSHRSVLRTRCRGNYLETPKKGDPGLFIPKARVLSQKIVT